MQQLLLKIISGNVAQYNRQFSMFVATDRRTQGLINKSRRPARDYSATWVDTGAQQAPRLFSRYWLFIRYVFGEHRSGRNQHAGKCHKRILSDIYENGPFALLYTERNKAWEENWPRYCRWNDENDKAASIFCHRRDYNRAGECRWYRIHRI